MELVLAGMGIDRPANLVTLIDPAFLLAGTAAFFDK